MSDNFSETSSQSWFGRIGNSIKGILFGFLFLAGSIFLLCWNEGRAVTTASSLKEGAGAVVAVPDAVVLPANEQKLIHISGQVGTEETLHDPVLGIEATALRLTRKVEMFQWKEKKTTESHKKLGGGEETTTHYEYSKDWSEKLIRSREFKSPEDHVNPETMPVPTETLTTSKAMLGAFRISPTLVGLMHGDESFQPSEAMLASIPAAWKAKCKTVGSMLYLGNDASAPAVGDARVTFQVLQPAVFSVLSRQMGADLEPYATHAGREIQRVESGAVSADMMFQHAQSENTILTWALRVGGFVLMAFGLSMIMNPLVILADVVPFFGSLVGMGTGLISAVVAFAGSLVVIAISWLVVRPILGGSLLVLAVAALVLGIRFARQRARTPAPV